MSHETIPEVYLRMEGADWPPARPGVPAGTSRVGNFTVERELVARGLPDNTLHRSGLSVGSGSAEIPQATDASNRGPLAPWQRNGRRVTVGHDVDLYASHEGPATNGNGYPLGSWRIPEGDGSLTSPSLRLPLAERQSLGKRQTNLLNWDLWGHDPAGLILDLARQLGYSSVPMPGPGVDLLADVPFTGAGIVYGPAGNQSFARANVNRWGTIALELDSGSITEARVSLAGSFNERDDIFFTFNGEGNIRAEFILANTGFRISPTGQLRAQTPGGLSSIVNVARGLDPNWPHRVQIQMQFTAPINESWQRPFRLRARSAYDAPWSDWTDSIGLGMFAYSILEFFRIGSTPTYLNGLVLSFDEDESLWAPPNAFASMFSDTPSGYDNDRAYLPGDMNVWDGMQEIASAHLGGVWVDNHGNLQVQGRKWLAGSGRTPREVDVAREFEDIEWSLSADDAADRLVIEYRPQVGENVMERPVWAWESEEPLRLDPGETLEVIADLPGPTTWVVDAWLPAWSTNPDPETAGWSVYGANTSQSGTGTNVELDISARRVSAGRVIITLRNPSNSVLYTVDGNGAPCLLLKSSLIVNPDTVARIERGATEEKAVNEIVFDTGTQVSLHETARNIADFLWARVNQARWKASGVRVRLDWSYDLGDYIRLNYGAANLDARALVTKVRIEGTAGKIAQYLDFVLLPPTWDDFDETWAGQTWDDFDAAWAGKTWNDFDAEPLAGA